MTKYQIPNLLDELRSDEAYTRNNAIKIIIKEKINDEQIINALKEIIENDQLMSVRNFARAALDVFGIEHSATEDAEEVYTSQLTPNVVENNIADQNESELSFGTEGAYFIIVASAIITSFATIFLLRGVDFEIRYAIACIPAIIFGSIAYFVWLTLWRKNEVKWELKNFLYELIGIGFFVGLLPGLCAAMLAD